MNENIPFVSERIVFYFWELGKLFELCKPGLLTQVNWIHKGSIRCFSWTTRNSKLNLSRSKCVYDLFIKLFYCKTNSTKLSLYTSSNGLLLMFIDFQFKPKINECFHFLLICFSRRWVNCYGLHSNENRESLTKKNGYIQ